MQTARLPARFLLWLVVSFWPGRASVPAAEGPGPTPAGQRMQEVQALFRANPGGYEAIFAPSFLKAAPAPQLDAIFRGIFAQYGRCVEATPASADAGEGLFGPAGPTRGRYTLRFERGDVGAAAAPARAILTINPGLPGAMGTWDYVGFKGGSEPGVISLTFLMRPARAEKGWLTLSATWNNPQAPVDEGLFTNLVGRALRLASGQ